MSAPSDPDSMDELPWPKLEAPCEQVSQKICSGCTHGLKPKRRLSSLQRLLLSLTLSFGVFALLAWLTHERARQVGTFREALIGAAGWGIVQAAVLWVGVAMPPGRRIARAWRLVIAIALPVAFLLYIAAAAPAWASFHDFSHGARVEHALGCGVVGLLFGALISGGVLLLWRGTDPLNPGLTGALAGLVGGVGGALTINIGCSSQEGWHACFAHGLGVLAFVGFGWAVGRRLLSP